MKLAPIIAAWLLSLITFTPVVSGQRTTCSCEAPDQSCHTSVTCPGGCTAVCGSSEACYLSCLNNFLYGRITLDFVHKSGEEIAAVLSERTHKKIIFVPYERNRLARYNLQIDDDNVWNTLNFLHKRGGVSVGGLDFGNLEKMRRDMATGGKISVNFSGIPVKDVIAELSFLSGRSLRVVSGNSDHLVSISLRKVKLDEVVSSIAAQVGVQIEEGKKNGAN